MRIGLRQVADAGEVAQELLVGPPLRLLVGEPQKIGRVHGDVAGEGPNSARPRARVTGVGLPVSASTAVAPRATTSFGRTSSSSFSSQGR